MLKISIITPVTPLKIGVLIQICVIRNVFMELSDKLS